MIILNNCCDICFTNFYVTWQRLKYNFHPGLIYIIKMLYKIFSTRMRPKLFYIEYYSTKVCNINLGIRKHNCIFIANYVPKNLPTLESLLYWLFPSFGHGVKFNSWLFNLIKWWNIKTLLSFEDMLLPLYLLS